MLSPDCADDVQAKLKDGAKTFYTLPCRAVYESMIELRSSQVAVDVITLQAKLKDKGVLDGIGGAA